MNEPHLNQIQPTLTFEEQGLPRMYVIKYASRYLLLGLWGCLGVIILLFILAVILSPTDISSKDLSALLYITPALKNMIVLPLVPFFVLVGMLSFYRKEGSIVLGERGIRFLDKGFISWGSLKRYKIAYYPDRYNLKQAIFEAKEGYKIRLVLENDGRLADLQHGIQEALKKYGSSVEDTGSKSALRGTYLAMLATLAMFILGGIYVGWAKTYLGIAIPVLAFYNYFFYSTVLSNLRTSGEKIGKST